MWREERLMTRIYNVGGLQTAFACRGYVEEPEIPGPENWPSPIISSTPVLPVLKTINESLLL